MGIPKSTLQSWHQHGWLQTRWDTPTKRGIVWAETADPRPPVFDAIYRPSPRGLHPLTGFAIVGAVSPEVLEAWSLAVEWSQEERGAIAVGTIRGRHDGAHDPALGIDQPRTLAPLDVLPPSEPRGPPSLIGLTDWLSMMAALGWGSRPPWRRTAVCPAWWSAS